MEDSRINSLRILAAGLFASLFVTSCSYHNANLSFPKLAERNIYIASHPTLSADAKPYGEVAVTRRFLYGWPCSMSANTTLESLRKAALDRGANLVIDIEFEGESGWSTNPQCRRNLNWGWLIIPMFLPVPQSVSIRGKAVFDPAFET